MFSLIIKRYDIIFLTLFFCVSSLNDVSGVGWRTPDDKTKCPKVRGIRNFDISKFSGSWFVIQYYASSEEALAYRCMRAKFSVSTENTEVTMNFTYSFTDDPINEQLAGNITWKIPDPESPAHWIHEEVPYEGIYNTYVLDSDYKSWTLLMHCAEKEKSPRYLSSFIMSRTSDLGNNVISYLREKLPKYDVDLEYMFSMEQTNCTEVESISNTLLSTLITNKKLNSTRRHPLKRKHKPS